MTRTVPLLVTAVAAALTAGIAAPAGPAAAPQPIPGIRSPSGNIQCLFVPPARGTSASNLLCTIGRADYSAVLQHRCSSPPTSLDWHGFELPATKHGPFTCASRLTGVTCTNTRGHGLFLSRQSWRAW
jgi:hypothetical protein